MTLLLLRHAPTELNEAGRWNGQLDPRMSAVGHDMVVKASAALRSALGRFERIDVVTSDLNRARETADVIADALHVSKVNEEPDLRERDMGAWSGLSGEEAAEAYPAEYQAWRAGELTVPPDGESDQSVAIRAIKVINKWDRREDGAVAVVVTHAGVLQALAGITSSRADPFPPLSGFWASVDDAGIVTIGQQYHALNAP